MNGIRFSCQEGMSILIQIDIVDYDNLSSLGMRITKYVNSNLRDRYLETQSEKNRGLCNSLSENIVM